MICEHSYEREKKITTVKRRHITKESFSEFESIERKITFIEGMESKNVETK